MFLATDTVNGDVEVGYLEVGKFKMLKQGLVINFKMDDITTLVADGVMVGMLLNLVARFSLT